MSFKMNCPHCAKPLNVTEKAFGKTVPCPNCNGPLIVPAAGDCDGEPTVMPPPIPDDPPPTPAGYKPRAPKAGYDLLANYHTRSKPKGEQIKEKFKHSVIALKQRGTALKLQHEVASLQTAVDGQLELLGTMMLTHRPPSVPIEAEIAELSRVQDELARKESTIDSLRQTRGGGSAVKELKQEAAQLRKLQQAVMVAIGKAARAAKTEMPGADGAYAALDRLQSSLESKQGELRAVADEVGPLWDAGGLGISALRRPAVTVGAIAGGLILLYLFWSLLVGILPAAGLPGWVRCYPPRDTQTIVYFNMDKFRNTEVSKKLEGLLPSRAEVKRFWRRANRSRRRSRRVLPGAGGRKPHSCHPYLGRPFPRQDRAQGRRGFPP